MDLIRFIGTTARLHADLSISGNRVVMKPVVMPTDDELALGFEILNEHNGIVQGDYSTYKYIYKKDATSVILTTDVNDVYVAPTYAKILYLAGDNGSVTLGEETVQTNAEVVSVKGSTARANDLYQFVNWTNANGKEVGTEAKFIPEVTASTTDTTYTANFELIPVPEKTLDDVKAEKLTEIENNYSVAMNVGSSTTLSDGTTISFSITQDFINDASAAFNLASALYGTDGITVPFEINKTCYQYAPLDVIYIYIAMQIYIVACKSLRNELIGTVNRAVTKDAVEAITFSTESLDETGLEGYQASMAAGQNMIAVMKQKFGIEDVSGKVNNETTTE
jgi:hypothetical protein